MTAAPTATDRVRIANEGSHPITLVVAPAALEQLLAPGAAAVVEARGPAGPGAGLLVERTCDTAAVWTWAGARARILADDGRVLASEEGAGGRV